MKTRRISMILAAVILAAFVQQALAQSLKPELTILLGTTGACNNPGQGGQGLPCTNTSKLVELDPVDGAFVREIGEVGYTVNGFAWDETSGKLYATTSAGCGPGLPCPFHGLITIDPQTGGGKPVHKNVVNFGLDGEGSPIHSITIDADGNMVGWYDEFPGPDSYVHIDKHTGVAVEFDTGINTSRNGLAFDEVGLLWNIDSPRVQEGDPDETQTAYIIDPLNGEPFVSVPLDPFMLLDPLRSAALGDFNPENNLYYGLDFDDAPTTFIVVIDFLERTVTELGQTVDDLHTITFVKGK